MFSLHMSLLGTFSAHLFPRYSPLLLAVGTAVAGEAELKKFQETLAKYEERLLSLRPAHEVLDRRLQEVEKKFAAERNYAAADKILQERIRLADELRLPLGKLRTAESSKAPSLAADGAINLPLSAAKVSGANYDATQDVLTNWQSKDASGIWEVPGTTLPGAYTVEVTYAAGSQLRGSFTAAVDSFKASKEISNAGSPETFHAENLGTLRLAAQSTKLVISFMGTGGESLRLKSVRILPPADN
jgi:hypothetical protein